MLKKQTHSPVLKWTDDSIFQNTFSFMIVYLKLSQSKTNKVAYVPSEDSAQPDHWPIIGICSLIIEPPHKISNNVAF